MGVGLTELPSGMVTFLFSDIEGSTRLWQATESHDGHVMKTAGGLGVLGAHWYVVPAASRQLRAR